MLRKELSLLRVNEWSRAEYVAVVDSDIVFVSFGAPEILFDRSSGGFLPIIFGRANAGPFKATVMAMGLQWQAEFMDSFPLIINRLHVEQCQKYLVSRFCHEAASPYCRSRDAIDYAFFALQRETGALTRGVEFPSFHSIIGSFLWNFHRTSYSWSIQYGHLYDLPLHFSCPFLRVTSHVSYTGTPEDPHFVSMRIGGAVAHEKLGGGVYSKRAWRAIAAGVCAVRWRRLDPSTGVVDDGPLSIGLARIRDEFCSDSRNISMLLLASGYDRPWTEREATHCAGRRPSVLLAGYHNLLEHYSFDF